MAQILSVSRRTDIPAFYGDWFMRRVRASWCAVPNPFNRKQVSRVEFRPGETVLVFWTRWPAPFLKYLAEIEARGYPFYFLYTLVDYPRALEPQAPKYPKSLALFQRLAERIGPERLIWRYDPIILSEALDADYHLDRFERTAQALRGCTEQAVISIADHYPKVRRRLKDLGLKHPHLAPRAFEPERDGPMLRTLAEIAAAHGLRITGCAPQADLCKWTIAPGKCIDEQLIQRLCGLAVPARKDKSQRPTCGCVQSRDIGMYDSCLFGCLYCYATQSFGKARDHHRCHDPAAESLLGDFKAPEPRAPSATSAPLQADLFA